LHPHVGLVHREVDRADTLALCGKQVKRGIDPVLVAQLRNLGQPPANVRLMLWQAEADRHHAGWRRVVRHCLPVTSRLQHFGADFRAH